MRASNYRKKLLISKKTKKMIWGALAAVILAGIIFFFAYFRVTSVELMGSTRYSDEEIKELALQGPFSDNSILAALLYAHKEVEDVPFVEGIHITRINHNTICISVKEKKAVGCIPYLDSYIYFDRNGVFIESSRTRDESIPYFDGIEVNQVIMNEKLPIKGTTILNTAVALATIFQKNDKVPDHIEFDSNYQISLVYGNITVMLGKDKYLEDKMNRALAILPKISGETGILHLENVTDSVKTITFEREVEEVTAENWNGGYDENGDYTGDGEYDEDGKHVGPKPMTELDYALANWHGGYDEEGDYTGEGEYDENWNYVGPKPTAESIAANGDWHGGYMEDGSYTGYGELDREGNYVGPNPNETSDDGSEDDEFS
ncbi:cell division protein FtsQ/DivIB [Ruminococcus sp. 5_1_39BFAA]|uniref:cell division protein FtsQ/DivIB n=1 Tax=Ruminococcus sp. 5_1_39BFAA TaxID=457412 RepID=UPI003565ED57